MLCTYVIIPESDAMHIDTKQIQLSVWVYIQWKLDSWWWGTSVDRGLDSGQTLWSWERCYSRGAYWAGLIWVQINTVGTWPSQVAPAVLKRQLFEVNPVINNNRLTELCVPGCHSLQGQGVQWVCFQEPYTQDGYDGAQIANHSEITTIISTIVNTSI